MIFWMAMIVLNVIAILAMTVADLELARALREMERLSSDRSTFFPSIHASAMPYVVLPGDPNSPFANR